MTKVRSILERRWPILVATLLLGIVAGVLSTFIGPDRDTTMFQAEQVLVANPMVETQLNVPQDALKVTRGEVPRVAAELLGEPPSTELVEKISVVSDEESNSITLTARDADPEYASDLVQAHAQAFLEVVNAELRSEETRQLEQLRARVDEAADALATFDAENASVIRPDVPVQQTPALDALLAERDRLMQVLNSAEQRLQDFELQTVQREPYTTLGPEVPEPAGAELLAIPQSIPVRAGVLGLVGLLLGVALVMLIERINQRIDTREELAPLISVPILAEVNRIPKDKRPTDTDGRVILEGLWSEHYRRVRSAIQFVQADALAKHGDGSGQEQWSDGSATTSAHGAAVIHGHESGHVPRVFMVVSSMPSEGKSTSTALTAMALAETGDETLVINADFRKPTIEKYLDVPTSPSLADLAVLSPTRPSIDQIVQPTATEHLWVAAAGPPTLEVKERIRAARELAVEAARRGGTVLIDSSPLRVTNDPIDLLPVVDEVILVVRAGQTTVRALQDTIEMLDQHHAPVLGVLLIGTATTEMYTYYNSYLDEAAKADEAGHRQQEAAWSSNWGQAPQGQAPQVHAAQVHAPQVQVPQPYAPQQFEPQVQAPQPYAPQQFEPQVQAQQPYAPQQYEPQVQAPQPYAPQPYAPQPYAPQPYEPQVQAPQVTYGYPPNDGPAGPNGVAVPETTRPWREDTPPPAPSAPAAPAPDPATGPYAPPAHGSHSSQTQGQEQPGAPPPPYRNGTSRPNVTSSSPFTRGPSQ